MARPRKVPPEDSLTQRQGDPAPKAGTYAARRARAALRADESRRLSVDEARERMAFSEEQLRVLDAIAAGLPVRAARECIAALRLKADFLLSKPAGAIDHRLAVYRLVDPYAEEPQKPTLSAAAVVTALPEGQDEAPPSDDEDEP